MKSYTIMCKVENYFVDLHLVLAISVHVKKLFTVTKWLERRKEMYERYVLQIE